MSTRESTRELLPALGLVVVVLAALGFWAGSVAPPHASATLLHLELFWGLVVAVVVAVVVIGDQLAPPALRRSASAVHRRRRGGPPAAGGGGRAVLTLIRGGLSA